MTATTPKGTETFSIFKPLGRTVLSSTRPTGSSKAATARTPFDMAISRSFVNSSLSSIASESFPFARSISARFAARIFSALYKRACATA